MVAALPAERQIIAEPAGDLGRPGSSGDHDTVSLELRFHAALKGDFPAIACFPDIGDAGFDNLSACIGEKCQIGIGQRGRARYAAGVVEQHGFLVYGFQSGFDLPELFSVENAVFHTDFVTQGQLGGKTGKTGFAAEHFHPAGMSHQVLDTGICNPLLVLGE